MVPAPAHSAALPPALLRDHYPSSTKMKCVDCRLFASDAEIQAEGGDGAMVDIFSCVYMRYLWLKPGTTYGIRRSLHISPRRVPTRVSPHLVLVSLPFLITLFATNTPGTDLDNVRRRSEISAPKAETLGHWRVMGLHLKSANVAQAALGRNQLLPLGVQILADAARSLRTIADMYRLLQSRYSLGLITHTPHNP
ncbi:hypothetical protein BDZ97DRAFT_1762803 [Flammula alnicola]|nr:hypothetical protein BDZ97DRAFT_1762803 [Flammula alnicola]